MAIVSFRSFFTGLVVALWLLCLQNLTAIAQSPDYQIHVATTGENSDSCGSPEQPCRTIQHAVNRAANDEWVKILVAGGIYVGDAGDHNICNDLQLHVVVCIIHRRVELIGGFSRDNWTVANPAANPTIIDGQGRLRAMYALNMSSPENRLDMSGFTIQNGRATGVEGTTGDEAIFGFGGGILIDAVDGSLRDMVFASNVVVGVDNSSGYGGAASGGGLALRGVPTEMFLEKLTFVNNRAEGGAGADRGGYAIGGGFYSYGSVVRGQDIVAENNIAQAGISNGSGVQGNEEMADAQGGGFAFHGYSDILFEGVQVVDNKAIGGPASNGNGGRAFGGGFFAQTAANVILRDATVRGNLAQGGDGLNADPNQRSAGHARGGAMEFNGTPVLLERFTVVENRAAGGAGQIYSGSPGGGGISFTGDERHPATLINGVVADNVAEMGGGPDTSVGGGGGGLWLHGIDTTIDHCTFAGNTLRGAPLEAPAILSLESGAPDFDILIKNSIVALHQYSSNLPAIWTKRNATTRFENVLFAENAGNNNVGGTGPQIGLETTRNVPAIGFMEPGSPEYNYRLSVTSPAVNAASGSQIVNDLENRQRDAWPDLGAYEAMPFRVEVTAVSADSLAMGWDYDPGVASHSLTVGCSPGSKQPAEMDCGVPLELSGRTSFTLTSLTPYVPYTISLAAKNRNGEIVARAEEIAAFSTDQFVFLPIVVR